MKEKSCPKGLWKALSVQHPWAWLIVHADEYEDPKRIENRDWRTRYRGPLLIHAGKTFDRSGYESVVDVRPDLLEVMPSPAEFERGGIVGRVEVIDCVDHSPSIWYRGAYGFVLQGAQPTAFVPCRGRLSFFEVDLRELSTGRLHGKAPAPFEESAELRPAIVALADKGLPASEIARALSTTVRAVEEQLRDARAMVLRGEYRPALLPIECAAAHDNN